MKLAVPLLGAIFAVAALGLPLTRLWWRSGLLGFVGHRSKDPLARAIGLGFGGLVAVWGVYAAAVGVFGPDALGVWAVPPALQGLGVGAVAVGLAIVVTAQAQMGLSWRIGIDDRPTALVEHGLYRWSRNPIYTGVLFFVAGMLLAAPGWIAAGLTGLVVAAIAVQVRLEERHLLAVHGETFRSYARRVGRFVPGLGRL